MTALSPAHAAILDRLTDPVPPVLAEVRTAFANLDFVLNSRRVVKLQEQMKKLTIETDDDETSEQIEDAADKLTRLVDDLGYLVEELRDKLDALVEVVEPRDTAP